MFLSRFQTLKIFIKENFFYSFLLAFSLLLPFQFALNPAKGFDVAIVRIIIPIIFLIWIIFNFKNKQLPLIKNKVACLLLVFLFLATFSIVFSENLSWSLRKLLFLITIFPLYFISASILSDADKKRRVIFSLLIGGAILAWVAITQFFLQFIFGINGVYSFLASNITPFFLGNSFSTSVLAYPSWLVNAGGTTYMRAIAIFPDPHMLSFYLEMLIPWAIAMWALSNKNKGWLLLFVLSLILADVLTFTRGSYIALIAGSIIILPLVSKKTVIKILSGAILLGSLFFIAPHNPVAGRLASSFDMQEGSNQARLGNWEQAISIISTHPFGVGIGAYSLAVKPTATYREPIYAHNLYLDITSELGILAVLVFISILLITFNSFWKMSKKQPLFIAGVASITIFSVHSLVESPLYSVHILPLFLIILVLSFSTYEHQENIKSE